ncbi:MAG: hypothetical protein JRE40_14645, partial [Deltaproteobacteria bacterium]|nr:hypothetical protein [Deltaproteobacteria bacterium]
MADFTGQPDQPPLEKIKAKCEQFTEEDPYPVGCSVGIEEVHRVMGLIHKWANEAEAENTRLRAVHESELGVCEQHCEVVTGLRAENTALKAAATGDAWRLLDIANEEIVNLKDEIEERDKEQPRKPGGWSSVDAAKCEITVLRDE